MSDSDSSGPTDKEPPKKKQKIKTKDGKKPDEIVFELPKNRRVVVREFKGKLYVDIREFYEKDGKMLPGKKGISLTVDQWKKLKSLVGEIDEGLEVMES